MAETKTAIRLSEDAFVTTTSGTVVLDHSLSGFNDDRPRFGKPEMRILCFPDLVF